MKNRDTKTLFYHNSCYAMGTRLNVVIAQPFCNGNWVFEQIVSEVNRLERKLSRFDADSDISLINENAGRQPVAIDNETADILCMCRDYCRKTHSAFDVTLPSRADAFQQGEIAALTWSDALIIDSEHRTVAFSDPRVRIDLGGIGKGYAIGKIGLILKDNGIQNALVSFGESSILAMGHHPYGDCWKIGLADNPGSVFELRDQALSISGFHKAANPQICFHIINPKTLRPAESLSSIAVMSADPVEAEILSTALFASHDADTAFLDHFHDYRIIRANYSPSPLNEICTHE
jgi:thiamine biosynthesis lipoprotein